jgi:hypothetical protein
MSILSHSPNREIPNAFLIRALARSESGHCEGCGSRMFVKTLTGKCPHCRAGLPPQTSAIGTAETRRLPFAPRVGEHVVVDGLLTRVLSSVMASMARRQRRAAAPQRLALRAEEGSHAHLAAG